MIRNEKLDEQKILEKNWITHFLNRHPVFCHRNSPVVLTVSDHVRITFASSSIIFEGLVMLYASTIQSHWGLQIWTRRDLLWVTRDVQRFLRVKVGRIPVSSKMELKDLLRQLLLMDVFPSFLIEKVKKHHIGWYQYVNAEDEEAVSPKGWDG